MIKLTPEEYGDLLDHRAKFDRCLLVMLDPRGEWLMIEPRNQWAQDRVNANRRQAASAAEQHPDNYLVFGSPTAQFTPPEVHDVRVEVARLPFSQQVADDQDIPSLTDVGKPWMVPKDIAALIPPTVLHEGGEFTMQDLVDYHHWETARPFGRRWRGSGCPSFTFRLLSGENAPYRCAQCGRDVRDEEVEAWLARKNSTGSPSGE